MSVDVLPIVGCFHSSTWKEARVKKASSERIYTSLVDTRTGDIYNNDPAIVISNKCVMILIGLPVYTAGTMIWFTGKSVVELCKGRFSDAADALLNVVKSPFYAIAVLVASVFGIFSPFEGRKLEAMVENSWQRGISSKKDVRYTLKATEDSGNPDCVLAIQNSKCCYLAFCFQSLGNISDQDIGDVIYI